MNKLSSKLKKLSGLMKSEGLSNRDVNQFISKSVFGVEVNENKVLPKLSRDFSSETEEETNSEVSSETGRDF